MCLGKGKPTQIINKFMSDMSIPQLTYLTLNGIRFNKLGTIFQHTFTYAIHCLTFIQSQIYMSGGHFIYMEPVFNRSYRGSKHDRMVINEI
jgi:hypothetical protein